MCERTGAVVEVIPSEETGELDVAALEELLSRGGVKAVVITHVPTNGGVVNPATEGADDTVSRRNPLSCNMAASHRPSKRCAIYARVGDFCFVINTSGLSYF